MLSNNNKYLFFCAECEKLIRRMLQLEPAKRIPLSKVLEHRWMQGMEPDLQPANIMKVFGSNEHILWNTHVLTAIQKMNYDVDRCKQVGSLDNYYHHIPEIRIVLLQLWLTCIPRMIIN